MRMFSSITCCLEREREKTASFGCRNRCIYLRFLHRSATCDVVCTKDEGVISCSGRLRQTKHFPANLFVSATNSQMSLLLFERVQNKAGRIISFSSIPYTYLLLFSLSKFGGSIPFFVSRGSTLRVQMSFQGLKWSPLLCLVVSN